MTRTRLPAATVNPEIQEAVQVLASSTKNRQRKGRVSGPDAICQRLVDPASSPTRAATRQTCGPELPNSMGSGGSVSAISRNAWTQRRGSRRSHQTTVTPSKHARRSRFWRSGSSGNNPQIPPAATAQIRQSHLQSRNSASVIWLQSPAAFVRIHLLPEKQQLSPTARRQTKQARRPAPRANSKSNPETTVVRERFPDR